MKTDFEQRLNEYLRETGSNAQTEQLTPDASTREYFRIRRNGETAIACVYPEPFMASEQSFLDVSDLFRRNGLPVAEILDYSEKLGVIVQEDLGNTILRDVISTASDGAREQLLDEAIKLIARIQAATTDALESGSIAGRLKFDTEKLVWELNFFRTHYFETLRDRRLSTAEIDALNKEFLELSRELEDRASVLCHRDFHAANLMIDSRGDLRIIDHQDSRIGTTSYDLVSLLLDRITEVPSSEWLASKRELLLNERIKLGLTKLDRVEFATEFRIQTIQRCLKAIGTFSFQSVNRGKTYFIPFIKPMFAIVFRAMVNVDRFPQLRQIISRELED
jgi:aminoglycoside/choline kinase family phosphotransferase